MHIVFIVGNYYPNYTAVSKCVSNVAEILALTHQVTIICEKSSSNQSDEEFYNNQRILRIITTDSKRREYINKKIAKSKGVNSKFFSLILDSYKIWQAAKLILSYTSIKRELVELYENKLISITEPIDILIPSSMPYESVVASMNFKFKSKYKFIFVPYLFDQFVENRTLHRMQINRILKRRIHRNFEKLILSKSDNILLLKQLENFYFTNYEVYKHKFIVVEHPLLVKEQSMVVNVEDRISFLYAGSFYMKIRNPEFMLKTFDKILKDINGILNLFTFGNCRDILNEYSSSNELIKNFGSVETNIVTNEMKRSDFLVAVGNSDNTQIPSKIFEYLGMGLPIVYFYTIDDDQNVEILSKYPLSLCLKQDTYLYENNCSKLINFSIDFKNKRMDFEQVIKLFPEATPEFTVKLIQSFLKSV